MKTLLQQIGLHSQCCNSKIVAWDQNKYYCLSCSKTVDSHKHPAEKTVSKNITKPKKLAI